MPYLVEGKNDSSSSKFAYIKCCICAKEIDRDNQIYYVFIGRSKTISNEAFCVECYLADVREKMKLDPFLSPLYQKNFIRMNK
jgi:hypothetical protein